MREGSPRLKNLANILLICLKLNILCSGYSTALCSFLLICLFFSKQFCLFSMRFKKKTVRNTLRHKEIVPSRCKQCIHTTPFHCWGNCGALYQRMPVKLPHGQCVSSCVRQCLSLTLISTSVEQVVEARNSLLIKFILLCAVLKPFITKDDLQEWNRRFQLLGKKRSSTSSYLEVEVNKIRFNGCMQTLQVAIEFYVLWGTRGKLLPTQEI